MTDDAVCDARITEALNIVWQNARLPAFLIKYSLQMQTVLEKLRPVTRKFFVVNHVMQDMCQTHFAAVPTHQCLKKPIDYWAERHLMNFQKFVTKQIVDQALLKMLSSLT